MADSSSKLNRIAPIHQKTEYGYPSIKTTVVMPPSKKVFCSFEWNQSLCPLLIICVIKLNMTHGKTPQMPSAIALYGFLSNRFGLTEEAYRWGEGALALQETIGTDDTFAHVTVINHASSFLLVKKLSDYLETLRMGWDLGLKTGDVYNAMNCALLRCWMSLLSGQPLQTVSRRLVELSKSMNVLNLPSKSVLRAIQFHQQATGNLLGDPAYSHENDSFCTIYGRKSSVRAFQFKLDQMVVSVFLNNNEQAWEISEQVYLDKEFMVFKESIWLFIYNFYRGMSAFAMLHSSTTGQMRAAAKLCLKHLRKGKKKSPLNFSHQSYMLEAEYCVYRRKYRAAEKFYSKAIAHAVGITHEHALACERFGCYYFLRNHHTKACEQIKEAYRLYSVWGSRPKCDLLKKKYPCLSDVNLFYFQPRQT